MARRRVTLDEVAAASNTSSASVSLALRNKPGVSRETRERILAAAQALGYSGTIRSGRNEAVTRRNIALMFRTWSESPEKSSPGVNPFYSWVLTGIQEASSYDVINLLLGTIPVDDTNSPIDMTFATLQQPLDGVLLVGSYRSETVQAIIDTLGNPQPPVVLVDATDQGHGLDSVCSDNFRGGYIATSTLIAAGHRRIAWVGPLGATDRNFEDRFAGFRQALADHQLAPAAINNHLDGEAWMRGLDEVLSLASASFCGNDSTALSMIAECSRRGIAMPDTHSIVGFDDTTQARDAVPALTTVAVDKLSLGRVAIQMLDYRTRWPDSAPMTTTLRPRLIPRESVKEVHRQD